MCYGYGCGSGWCRASGCDWKTCVCVCEIPIGLFRFWNGK
jgi:hypothetical protein